MESHLINPFTNRPFSDSDTFEVDPETFGVAAIDAAECFMEGGSLAVPGGKAIVAPTKRVMSYVPRVRRTASEEDHVDGNATWADSFRNIKPFTRLTREMVQSWDLRDEKLILSPEATFTLFGLKLAMLVMDGQMTWPKHDGTGRSDSLVHPDLNRRSFGFIIKKANDPVYDSPSPYVDNAGRRTILADVQRRAGIKTLIFCGLVEEICLGWAVKSALAEGFQCIILTDCTARLNDEIADNQRKVLEGLGVIYCHSDQLKPTQTFGDYE